MKVLAYLFAYPPFRYTGGDLMAADLLEALAARGHTVDVYVHQSVEPYTRNGVRVQCERLLSREHHREYDVFYTHPEVRTHVWDRVHTLPYVAVVHNVQPSTLRSLQRAVPTLTVANSEWTRAHLPVEVTHGGRGSVSVLRPPVLLRQPSRTKFFVTMVNLSLEKGGSVLNYVAQRHPDMQFAGVLGGHGLQITNQPSNVKIVGPTEDMGSVYAEASALIFPTHSDTYGKVVAEAMQFGIPVIASDLPGVRECGGDAALYLDPMDYEAWDIAVGQLNEAGFYAHWSRLSKERGDFLYRRSLEDLDRWEKLVLRAASTKSRRKHY